MNPFAWLAARPPRQNGEALAFVRALSHEAALPYCTLAVPGRGGLDVVTLSPATAGEWLTKHAARRVYMLTAQTSGPLQGRAISENDLVQTRVAAIAVPAAAGRALQSFRPAPAVIVQTPKGYAAAWRLHNPATPEKARGLAAQIAAKLGGDALEHLFPLPGCGGVSLRKHLKGPAAWTLPTAFDAALGNGAATETAADEALFAPAADFEMEAVDWLWPDIIACGDLTLLGGAPGMGKSQMAIYAAATVSRGGTWPDGSRAQRGSVILCETEDRPETALRPRLEAAGADLARVSFGKHMDLSAGMAALAAQAGRLPDLRLLVLSPVLTFFGPTSTMTTPCAPSCGRCSNGRPPATSRCWASFTR